MDKRIVLGSDFAGFDLKEKIKKHLEDQGFAVDDLGMIRRNQPYPYHNVGYKVWKALHDGAYQRGIVICGSGMGIHISAGKWSGVHCALCESVETAKRSRIANDCNLLAIGSFYSYEQLACDMVDAFLNTEFGQGMDDDFIRQHRQWLEEMEKFDYQ